jgi:hypothetical protein
MASMLWTLVGLSYHDVADLAPDDALDILSAAVRSRVRAQTPVTASVPFPNTPMGLSA